jgi:phytoene synthase
MTAAALPSPVVAEARQTTRRVARTFAIACRFLPAAVRDDVYLLYLVFRTLDDLVDDGRPEAGARIAAVEAWTRGARDPATREVAVLDALAARYPLSRRPFADFCAGMRSDLDRRPFATEADVDLYCYRVAGTVGLAMCDLLGTRDERSAHPAAAALGMAMQRTNILRDLDEDREAGRTYVARESLDRFGPPLPGRRAALLRDQIARADALYDRGVAGIPQLLHGRRAVAAAAGMYREILRQIERDGLGEHPGRAVVARRRKVAIAARRAMAAR